ncbi:MAG: carboxypeptidase regulatory-like domain-containing protein [Deltaproteobacteria bacterium]|nr:carboxypeptidase regulatory-like domain-containing protein [Deltaproteobacteria bacterium]
MGAIAGRVVDDEGRPIEGALVCAVAGRDAVLGSVTTDANGVFRLEEPTFAHGTMTASAPRHIPEVRDLLAT